MGWFKKVTSAVKKVANYTPFTGFGAFSSEGPASQLGAMAGLHTRTVTAANKASDAAQANAAAKADADARQAEYEEQAAKGLERMRLRRRRGFSSTILTGGPASLGGSDYGKSLLGQ